MNISAEYVYHLDVTCDANCDTQDDEGPRQFVYTAFQGLLRFTTKRKKERKKSILESFS